MKKINLFLAFCLLHAPLAAYAENPDFFRSIGKMYVVVAVILAVFLGILFFLIYLDRKITKLENQIKDNE